MNRTTDQVFFFLIPAFLINFYIMPLIVWWISNFEFALNYFTYCGAGLPFALSCIIAAISIHKKKHYQNLYEGQ